MIDVTQYLRLGRKQLAPVPVLLEFVGERKTVFHARNVAARPRVLVPVPGAADVVAGFVADGAQAHFPQTVQRVKTGKAGTYHHNVKILRSARAHPVCIHACCAHPRSPVASWFAYTMQRNRRASRCFCSAHPTRRSHRPVQQHPDAARHARRPPNTEFNLSAMLSVRNVPCPRKSRYAAPISSPHAHPAGSLSHKRPLRKPATRRPGQFRAVFPCGPTG